MDSCLVIGDYSEASKIAKNYLINGLEPDLDFLAQAIKAHALAGNEKEALKLWERYVLLSPEGQNNRYVLESIAWGVLIKASKGQILPLRQMAILAAFLSQDNRSVSILYKGMEDSNVTIRAFSTRLASHLRDEKLLMQVKSRMKTEINWHVRQELILAVGEMKIGELRPLLEEIVGSDKASMEEKKIAIESLLNLLDTVEREEILVLANSNRAGLRLLACQAIAFFLSERDVDQLIILADDYHFQVRTAAIQALGMIRPTLHSAQIIPLAKKRCQDPQPEVAVSAAWLLALYEPQSGLAALHRLFQEERPLIRVCTAAAIRSLGPLCLGLSKQYMKGDTHPFVRLNLALHLIEQRKELEEASKEIENCLEQEQVWAEKKWGLFSGIVDRAMSGCSEESDCANAQNQLLRLDVLNKLAVTGAPNAVDAMRHYLCKKKWDISAQAALQVLIEGDEMHIQEVEKLLDDEHEKVRLNAALILSLWSREEAPLVQLQKSYPRADKETKLRIIESLGRIGSMQSVPFLMTVLKEPSQTSRVVAAMAIIQCVNH